MVIKSPLGALGALMVLLEGIAAAALVPLQSQPDLQRILVFTIVATISVLTVMIVGLIVYFARTNPGLLFNPGDIDPSVHLSLYGQGENQQPALPGIVTYETIESDDEPGGS